jgi:hypothetical protein
MKTIVWSLAIAVAVQGAAIAFLLQRGMLHEQKIKDMDRALNFSVLTNNGMDPQGMDLWLAIAKGKGGTASLFSWKPQIDRPIQVNEVKK